MKNTVLQRIFLVNYILLILYMSWHLNERQTGLESRIPLLFASLLMIDITYISACNMKENKVVSLFCGLLALDGWYVLLSFEEDLAESFVFNALSPIICYVSVKFFLMFLFQGNGYRFRKPVNVILLATCIGSLAGICMPDRIYAGLYGLQFLASWFSCLFIIIVHWKRTVFVLKSEWKCILFSVAIIGVSFLIYFFTTLEIKNHISNFGIYLPMLLFFISVHGIIRKEHNSYPISTIFSGIQALEILGVSLSLLVLITLSAGWEYEELMIAVNVLFVILYMCNIILERNLKQDESKMVKASKYNAALRQLRQEELLKTEFANFLHDDVLQDLLSVKNMTTKAHRPEVRDLIIETLDKLNIHIREQMQDYHPVILKTLTAKENYQNLIEDVSQTFPQRNIAVSFECSDALFLVEPYHLLIYRLLKELLTNVYKHSDGNRAWITLIQENSMIELWISDNGTAHADLLISADKEKHKGIVSAAEQVNNMDGTMEILDSAPQGVCIHIRIPMKGEGSYQYFIS